MTQENTGWTKILTELESGNCCLFLGPEIRCLLDNGNSVSVIEAFSNFIPTVPEVEYKATNFYYRASLYIKENYKEKPFMFEKQIQSFIDKYLNEPPEFFRKIVKLPFNSFISMTPDEFVSKALQNNGYDFVEDFYDYSNNETHDPKLVGKTRLVYYLYGKYSEASSVPVTEKAQVQLIKNLVAEEPPIPISIKKRLSDPKKSFLFLGVNFNDWQFRMILDALSIPKPALSIAHKIPIDEEVAFLTKQYYIDNFEFNFIDSDIQLFLEELIWQYEQKNGPLNRKKTAVFDFHERDREKFEICKIQLLQNGISNRVDFWDISNVVAGGMPLEKQIDEALANSDIYIPFLSSSFLNEKRNRLLNALQSTKKVIVIHSSAVGISAIPNISKAHILPSKDVALSSVDPIKLEDECLELAKTINAIVK